MSVNDIGEIMKFLVIYCAPCALVVNLVGYGAKVILGAITGKGLVL